MTKDSSVVVGQGGSEVPTFDRFEDEHKPLTMAEFEATLAAMMSDYRKELEGQNDFHKQPHTFDEWLGAFRRYISF